MISAIQPIQVSNVDGTKNNLNNQSDRSKSASIPSSSSLDPRVVATVKLSTLSQVRAMKEAGATVNQIAAKLNLSVADIDEELGLTASSVSSQASVLAALNAKS